MEKIVALYCRVSTEMQAEKGESISHQKAVLHEYCKQNGFKGEIYEDAGFSAKDTNRPAMNRLINDIKKDKIDTVIVTKLDRITRSMKDLIDLLELFEKFSVRFKSITQPFDTKSAIGRTFLNIMGAFAQLEREMISDRVSESLKFRAKKGKWNGGMVPYGYMLYTQVLREYKEQGFSQEQAEKQALQKIPDKTKVYHNPDEAKMVQQIFDKYLETESCRAVVHWLNSNKHKTRQGFSWSTPTVSRILHNPTYIGKIWYGKRAPSRISKNSKFNKKEEWIVVDGTHEAVIDVQKFNKVQTILDRQVAKPRQKMSQYLFGGLLRCGKCAGAVSGGTQRHVKNGNESFYSYYKCHTHLDRGSSVCTGISARKEFLEELVIANLLKLFKDREFKFKLEDAVKEFKLKTKNKQSPLQDQKRKLINTLAEIENKKRNLLMRLEDDTIDKETYKGRKAELDEAKEKHSVELKTLEAELNDISLEEIDFDAFYQDLKNISYLWQFASDLQKKDILVNLIKKIVLYDDKIKLYLKVLKPIVYKFDNANITVQNQIPNTNRINESGNANKRLGVHQ